MAELSPYIAWALDQIDQSGSDWSPLTLVEGPKLAEGHCVYCSGQCIGVTSGCELRVWEQSAHPWKRTNVPRK